MKKIKTRLGLSRVGMGMDTFMRFAIEDASSHILFAEINIPMESFAFLVSGMHGIEADCQLRGLENIGKIQESKTELIATPDDMPYKADDDLELVEDLLSPYQVDGWVAYVPDLFNFHKRENERISGKRRVIYQRVGFHRFVEADDNASD